MTTIVTPTTMTAAYNSLSTQQQNDFKTALGISGGSSLTSAGVVASPISSMTQGNNYILAALQMPKAGIVMVSGSVGLQIVGALNGTIDVGGCLSNILLSSSSKGSVGSVLSSIGNGEIVGGNVSYFKAGSGQGGFTATLDMINQYLTVAAGQWLTFTCQPIWQGTATNTTTVISQSTGFSTISPQANMCAYTYIA